MCAPFYIVFIRGKPHYMSGLLFVSFSFSFRRGMCSRSGTKPDQTRTTRRMRVHACGSVTMRVVVLLMTALLRVSGEGENIFFSPFFVFLFTFYSLQSKLCFVLCVLFQEGRGGRPIKLLIVYWKCHPSLTN